MSIVSFEFIFFISALLIVYYILPLRMRSWLLLLGSAAFWAFQGLPCAAFLVGESAIIWLSSLGIQKEKENKRTGKCILIPVLVLLFLALMSIKEWSRWTTLFSISSVLPFAFPLGLSYFTFQAVGYLMDVYRGKVKAEKNYFHVLLFCGFFPQLVQGPIDTWKNLHPQLKTPHRIDPEGFVAGVFVIAWGFFKKLVLADRIMPFVNTLIEHNDVLPGWLALFSVLAFSIALYADFSGGIDIVRGTAQLFGIHLAENFHHPFFARTVSEYWRRWHITLGAWFRTYVLYPLATSRASIWITRKTKKTFGAAVSRALPGALATFIVFVLIGLWHDFQWNALIFGAWFGFLSMLAILLEPFFKTCKKKLGITKETRWFSTFSLFRTWLAILIAQFFACTATPAQAFNLIKCIFQRFDIATFANFSKLSFYKFDPAEWIVAGAALVILLVVDMWSEHKKDFLSKLATAKLYIRWPLLMLLMLIVLIFGRYGTGYDAAAFVYAGF